MSVNNNIQYIQACFSIIFSLKVHVRPSTIKNYVQTEYKLLNSCVTQQWAAITKIKCKMIGFNIEIDRQQGDFSKCCWMFIPAKCSLYYDDVFLLFIFYVCFDQTTSHDAGGMHHFAIRSDTDPKRTEFDKINLVHENNDLSSS